MRMKTDQRLFGLFFVLCGVWLVSCESLVATIPESKLPHVDSKLVLQSFVSPQDSAIRVVVTETSPLFSESPVTPKIIKNATVILSNGTRSIRLPFDTVSELYSIRSRAFPIVAGGTYTLKVSDATRSAEASCTIPTQAARIESYTIDSAYTTVGDNPFGRKDSVFIVQLTWKDIPSSTNYYRVKASMRTATSLFENNLEKRRIIVNTYFNWEDNFGVSEFQSDKNQDGQALSSPQGKVRIPVRRTEESENSYEITSVLSFNLSLLTTSYDYYEYHKSVDRSRNSGNPFVEPSLVYSNVKGGLGIFAGYNNYKIEVLNRK